MTIPPGGRPSPREPSPAQLSTSQPSPREQMRDAVDKVMQQVTEKRETTQAEVLAEQQRLLRRERRRRPLVIIAALAFLLSLAYGIPRWRHPFPAPTGAAAEHDARRAIVFAAGLVERYVKTSGQPPASLEQVGVTLPGVTYQRVGSAYSLAVMVEGRQITFHSGDDLSRFLAGP